MLPDPLRQRQSSIPIQSSISLPALPILQISIPMNMSFLQRRIILHLTVLQNWRVKHGRKDFPGFSLDLATGIPM